MEGLRARYNALSTSLRVLASLGLGVVAFGLLWLLYRVPVIGSFLDDKAPLGIVIAGVIIGTVTALLAMGLILIYRTNRFINFAYGSMGSFAGAIAIGMHLEKGVPFFAALPVGVVIGVLTGMFVDLIVRRFANTSRLIVTVASIGIAQILSVLELLVVSKVIRFVGIGSGFTTIDATLRLDAAKTLQGDEVLILMVVPPILAAIAWFLLKTDAGIGVRAAAENADRALLLGIPIKRLTTIVWMIAGALAALTFILKAPSTGVTPGVASTGPVVLLPALAAAVVARMESLPIAFAAGIGLGVVEQVVQWNSSETPTLQYAVFLGIILLALLLQQGKLSRAQEGAGSSWSAAGILKPIPEELRRVPEVLWARRALIALVAAAFIFVPMGWSPSNQYTAGLAIVWAMAAVSLVILTGWGGHISLGQFAIVGVGGMLAGNMITRWNTDLILTLLAAGAAGAFVALLVGLPALRIRGLFLAVTTLALAVTVDNFVLNRNNFSSLAPSDVPKPLLLERFDLNEYYDMYALCLVMLGLSILVASGLRKGRAGRVIIATRDNQRAADAAAVPTTGVKLAAFVAAGAIAGVAGGLHVLLISALEPGTYPPYDSLNLFATSVIGGLGSIPGAITGVLLFRWIETIETEWVRNLRPFLTGGVLLFVLLALPGGLGQLLYNLRDRALRVVADRRGILVPSLVADKRESGTGGKAENEVGLLQGALADDAPAPRVPAGVA